ncbi:MAG TPA: hypothetical protein VN770_02385 [Gaiellaceae bacterium]|nr:hypothetical protein [Gaiellaceae bacterium]
MTGYDEERLAALLRLLPPAPSGWVEAAQELPHARAVLDSIVARATADAAYRARVLSNLEAALEAEGHEASPSVIAALRLRLGSG